MTLHLMLAIVTRYATGLIYQNDETDAETELRMQKELLIARFTVRED